MSEVIGEKGRLKLQLAEFRTIQRRFSTYKRYVSRRTEQLHSPSRQVDDDEFALWVLIGRVLPLIFLGEMYIFKG